MYENKEFIVGNRAIRMICLSEIGKGKIENQDAVGYYSDNNQLIVVVADGLGSAKFSNEGANRIVEVTIEALKNKTPTDNLARTIYSGWSEGLSGELSLYDTTVKFLHVFENRIAYGGIGDGWIVGKGKQYISQTSENLFSNQTDSILSFDLTKHFVYRELEKSELDIVLIATDGFSEDIDKENGSDFLESIKNDIEKDYQSCGDELAILLKDWPVTTNRDDKSVVILYLKGDKQ